jgi:hypothetical protein
MFIPVTFPHLQAGGRGMMLMKDEAPAHTAQSTLDLLQQQNMQQFPGRPSFQI